MTILGLQFSFLLAGAIIIENVFFLPGLGRLIFQGITQRDLIVVESVVMLLVFAVIVVTFLVDLAYAAGRPAAEAPRMRLPGQLIARARRCRRCSSLAALVSFVWTPYSVEQMDIAAATADARAARIWLGTDHFGRDILSMLMVGARTSIAVAIVAVGIGMVVGVPLGLLAAANRGSLLDEVVMRGNDLVFAFPVAGHRDPDHRRARARRRSMRSWPSASSTSRSSPG